MATSLANDMFFLVTKRSSSIYVCSLDAECAFDAISHYILYLKKNKIYRLITTEE